jgi:hypothetical protein
MLFIIGFLLLFPGFLGFVNSYQMDRYIHFVVAGYLVLLLVDFFIKRLNRKNFENEVAVNAPFFPKN